MAKVDLLTKPVTASEVRQFVNSVTEQAITDWVDRRKAGRTGDELCNLFTRACRKGHKQMASTLYNKVRWSLEWNEAIDIMEPIR